jgi:hypothetical protein
VTPLWLRGASSEIVCPDSEPGSRIGLRSIMATVELRDIRTAEDRAAVLELRRGPGQERFLGSMESHFKDAKAAPDAKPRMWSVHDGEDLVGFVMISDNIEDPGDDLIGPLLSVASADRRGVPGSGVWLRHYRCCRRVPPVKAECGDPVDKLRERRRRTSALLPAIRVRARGGRPVR